MTTAALLQSLFDHKAWADDELLAQLQALDPAAHEKDRHTCIRILNHVHVVDRLFQAQLQRAPLPFAGTNTPDTPALAALHEAVRETDGWYRQQLHRLADDELDERIAFHFVDGDAGCMTRAEMLLHVAMHGSYHRGAVGRILVQCGLTPPRDLLTGFLHLAQPERRQHPAAA